MAFTGFEKDAMQFFHELSLEMNRDWYEANKQRYTSLWALPMTALLETVATRLAKTYAPIKVGAPKLFRIYRDVRFSKDKTPYKTHCAGMLPLHQAKKPVEGGCTVLYLHLGVEDEYVGAGTYFFDEKQLPRWRKLVASKSGAEIEKLITKLRNAGYEVGGHEDYKKVPKGFDPEHPRADLLRMRGLTAAFPAIPRGLVHQAKFADWIVDHSKKVAPLVTWLYRNVK